mmetsp:Transcript_8952/g.36528  ORF Transcript_8952/g.36528 Transcript_8952/m.36528 type:complete len:279 (-) Transcript_8952:1046-1882(-)
MKNVMHFLKKKRKSPSESFTKSRYQALSRFSWRNASEPPAEPRIRHICTTKMYRICQLMKASYVERLYGGADAFMTMRDSCPVYTTQPTTLPVFLSVVPRRSTSLMESATFSEPSMRMVPSIDVRLGEGASAVTSPSSMSACATLSVLTPGATERSLRLVSPSRLAVFTKHTSPSRLVCRHTMSAGNCSLSRTSTVSPTFRSCQATRSCTTPAISSLAPAAPPFASAPTPPLADDGVVDAIAIPPSAPTGAPPGALCARLSRVVKLSWFNALSSTWRL